ncbi:EEF1A lysine methyltransferase 1-like [Asterias rubens]|uniref:EEF1A lysine methyltransferase 1-like n=1 Tax=Asterias rubens TaxID=7604 RepID=UPI001455AA30|nr:EEF1A lysine methyltransferase 1-like [Asterias rubens]
MSDSDDEVPQLSAETMAALQEFYSSQAKTQSSESESQGSNISENWNLSQFWYDEVTSDILAKEALEVAGESGRIACVSSPTLYQKLQQVKPPSCTTILLEFDKRFSVYGDDFVFYDYNAPLELSNLQQHSFDVVIADPPYLAEECLKKTAQTIKYLTKGKIILCTGAVMLEIAQDLLGVTVCPFIPHHTRNLANEFRCYANFQTHFLNTDNR